MKEKTIRSKSVGRIVVTTLFIVSLIIATIFLCKAVSDAKSRFAIGEFGVDIINGEKGKAFQETNFDTVRNIGITEILYFSVYNEGDIDFQYNIDIDASNCGNIGDVEYILLSEDQILNLSNLKYESLVSTLDLQPKPLKEGNQTAISKCLLEAKDKEYYALVVHINNGSALNGEEISVGFTATAMQIPN